MARLVRGTERHDFHFELGHLAPRKRFHLRAGAKAWELKQHTPESLAEHAGKNEALALIPPDKRSRITHYVEGVELPDDRALMLRVTYPRRGEAALPGLALLALHTPRKARRRHRAAKSELFIPLLWRYGLEPYRGDDAVEFSIVADGILSTMNTATGLIFQQPQLATVNADTATIITDDHINTAQNARNVGLLQETIEQQSDGWSVQGVSSDWQGNPLTWAPRFSQAGQNVAIQQLAPAVQAAVGTPAVQPLTTSLNDARLQNSSWATFQGIGSVAQDSSAPAAAARVRRRPRAAALGLADASSDFTINNLTPGYGLDIDASSFVFTPDPSGGGSVSINVTNNYLRSLWAWVQFFGPDGDPLGDYQSVSLVSPVNVVLGIPVSTDPTTLTFTWPEGASSATLAHGGLGVSNWQDDIVWNGIVLTGIFNYAIPMLFLYAGASDDDNSALTAIEEEPSIWDELSDIAQSVLGSLASNSIGFPNVKTVLSAFADGIAGILVHAGLDELQDYLAEQLGETAFEDAIPFVDVFFQVLNDSVDLVELGETTVEVLCSPAVYEVSIVRSMPLQATVSPDPLHGSDGNPAIWPLDSDHYQCIVQYQGGTSFKTTGPMLGANSSQAIGVSFDSIPEGGTLQVQFGVYAFDETLLGNWTSAWVPAVRPAPGQTLTLTGAIQEQLIPLTQETRYSYKEKLVYSKATSSHMWQPEQFGLTSTVIPDLNAGQVDATTTTAFAQNGITLVSPTVQVTTPSSQWSIVDGTHTYSLQYTDNNDAPEIVVTTGNAPSAVLPLNEGDLGNNLGATIGITMNDKAYMIGYCWMGSGENVPAAHTAEPLITSQINTFQNISGLSQPDSALKFSGVGYANQPFVVYDQFGPAPLFAVPSSYEQELNAGTVGSDLATLFQQFAYPLPSSGVTVTVNAANVAWTINVDGTATYALQAVPQQINVFLYPAVAISQNNFFLEPTSTDPNDYQYQVRQIVLDDSTPFNVDQQTSWGLFQLPHLNDVVVHPQGYLVGAHSAQDILEILPIPATPTPDALAQPATLIGGSGTRPGLYGMPSALAVTADGRILVLEPGNGRVQAIDVSGNPVPCFTAGSLGSVPPSYAGDLDAGRVSTDLRTALANAGASLSAVWRVQDSSAIYQLLLNGDDAVTVTTRGASPSNEWKLTDSSATPQLFDLTLDVASSLVNVSQNGNPLFSVSADSLPILNAGLMPGDLASAFSANGITLEAPIEIVGNGLTLDAAVVSDLTQGNVPASLAPGLAAAGITLGSPAAVTASVAVRIIQSTAQWQLVDTTTNITYGLQADPASGQIFAVELSPVMALNPPPAGQTLTYLGMSAEARGYIFVLRYAGAGNDAADFAVDIYAPDGSPLATTPGVNAGDLVVDLWRNLYTLNFESFLGPGGRTEPSISVWTPSV